MILLDVNVLIYAYTSQTPQHTVCLGWLEDALNGTDVIGLPWVTVWAFLRVTSNARLGGDFSSGMRTLRELIAQPGVVIVEPASRHLALLERMVIDGQASGPLVSDAVLAALALENGATLASTDRDFSRFPGLEWVNPLDGEKAVE